ncbi:MAG: response regulator [Chitinophagaceae bacterium]
MKKRILIFDDDRDILTIVSFILKSAGYEVFIHENCIDIVQKLREFHPNLVMMDNKIPTEGGIKSTQLIKATEDLKHTPVIFFSANSEVKRLANEAQADYFIEKPFEADDLLAMVSKALDHSSASIQG